MANTSRGEVALFRTSVTGEPLVDLDHGSPSYGFIPVGSMPTDLKATRDGCRVVTANSGSCDLGLIDVPGVLKVAAGELTVPSAGMVSRVIPRTAAGPLRARPQEVVIVPEIRLRLLMYYDGATRLRRSNHGSYSCTARQESAKGSRSGAGTVR